MYIYGFCGTFPYHILPRVQATTGLEYSLHSRHLGQVLLKIMAPYFNKLSLLQLRMLVPSAELEITI